MTTLTELLYHDRPAAASKLRADLVDRDLLPGVARGPGTVGEVVDAIVSWLEMPLADLAVTAYLRHRLIEAAKRNTSRAPGTREVVRLLKHTIHVKQEASVEVEIGAKTVTVVRLEVTAEITVDAVTAVVEAGHIKEIAPGEARGSVTLKAGGVELAAVRSRPVDLTVPDQAKIVIDLTGIGEPIPAGVPHRQRVGG